MLFLFCWLIIPIYLVLQKDQNQDKALSHSIVSMVLFPVWVYSINGLIFDDQHWNWYSAALSAILLALATLISGAVPNSFTASDLKELLPFGTGLPGGGSPAPAPTTTPTPTATETRSAAPTAAPTGAPPA